MNWNIEVISHKNHTLHIEWELTPEQKTEILDYLKQKNNENKSLVLNVSKNELTTLKQILDTQSNDPSLWEFLESQEKQTYTSTEILEWSQVENLLGGKERLQVFLDIWDEMSKKYLFDSSEWLLKWVDLSLDVQHNFAVWLHFFVVNFLYTKIDQNWSLENLNTAFTKMLWEKWEKGILEKLPDLLSSAEGIWNMVSENYDLAQELYNWDLKNVINQFFQASQLETLKKALWELELENRWAQNGVLNNPKHSHDLFQYIFDNPSLTKEDIKAYIENKNWIDTNFTKKNQADLREIWDNVSKYISPEMWMILGKALDIKQIYIESKDKIKNSIINNDTALSVFSFLKEIPFIWKFIDMFLWFLGIENIDEILKNKEFKKYKEQISKNIIWEHSLFESKKLWKNFMLNNSWKPDLIFIENIKFLTKNKTDENLDKQLQILFEKWWDFEQFTTDFSATQDTFPLRNKITHFGVQQIDYKNLADSINYYREFKKYKNWKSDMKEFIEYIYNKEQSAEKQKNDMLSQLESGKIDLVTEKNKFEITDYAIDFVFENSDIKYKCFLDSNGDLIIKWWWQIVTYSWASTIFNKLQTYKNILNEEAKGGHFSNHPLAWTEDLWGKSVQEVLIKWHEENLWLQDIIVQNFIKNKKITTNDVSINFLDQKIVLKKEKTWSNTWEKNSAKKVESQWDKSNETSTNLKWYYRKGNLLLKQQGEWIRLEISGKKYKLDNDNSLFNEYWEISNIDWKTYLMLPNGKKIDLDKFYEDKIKWKTIFWSVIDIDDDYEFEEEWLFNTLW